MGGALGLDQPTVTEGARFPGVGTFVHPQNMVSVMHNTMRANTIALNRHTRHFKRPMLVIAAEDIRHGCQARLNKLHSFTRTVAPVSDNLTFHRPSVKLTSCTTMSLRSVRVTRPCIDAVSPRRIFSRLRRSRMPITQRAIAISMLAGAMLETSKGWKVARSSSHIALRVWLIAASTLIVTMTSKLIL